MSSYLTFRYVVDPEASWAPGVTPGLPEVSEDDQVVVSTSDEIHAALESLVAEAVSGVDEVGIFLSGGIDSAILAALLPSGTHAFSIRFVAEGAIDETVVAKRYAEAKGLDLHVVDVTWEDYLDMAPGLMRNKKSPLHAVEVGLFKAARAAADLGITTIMLGNGADSTFGGMDRLLSRDWSFDAFVKRYTFVDPASALVTPVSMLFEYEKYRKGDGIDVVAFLKRTHGIGIIQAFDNAIGAAGCRSVEPFEKLRLGRELDLERIRAGEPKYLLQSIFKGLYPGIEPPRKVPFARPMDQWLDTWEGPRRPEFRPDLKIEEFTGDQRWLLWCLERFLDMVDHEET